MVLMKIPDFQTFDNNCSFPFKSWSSLPTLKKDLLFKVWDCFCQNPPKKSLKPWADFLISITWRFSKLHGIKQIQKKMIPASEIVVNVTSPPDSIIQQSKCSTNMATEDCIFQHPSALSWLLIVFICFGVITYFWGVRYLSSFVWLFLCVCWLNLQVFVY